MCLAANAKRVIQHIVGIEADDGKITAPVLAGPACHNQFSIRLHGDRPAEIRTEAESQAGFTGSSKGSIQITGRGLDQIDEAGENQRGGQSSQGKLRSHTHLGSLRNMKSFIRRKDCSWIKSLSENCVRSCFRGKGCRARRDEGANSGDVRRWEVGCYRSRMDSRTPVVPGLSGLFAEFGPI